METVQVISRNVLPSSEYVNQGKLTGVTSHKLEEELPPVTKFDEAGKKNRKLYFELVNCKYKETRTDMYGAGCSM